jgi:predicted phage terminase large subunit-like protein
MSHAFARESLAAYAIAHDENYQVAWHHRLIAQALERVERGELTRLIINMPPRHGKSKLASQFFPAWYLGRNPGRYIIAASYSKELAEDMGQAVRDLTNHPMHRAVFPGSMLRQDSKARSRFMTRERGVYFGTGIGGPITGKGAHLLLIDDPVKSRAEADSEIKRRAAKRWYGADAYTRLMPGGAIVVIQTRWHEDDLAGWLLREHAHEGWEVLSLPAIADADEHFRKAGTALWPEAYPLERLDLIRKALVAEEGPRSWLALYQQAPVADEGVMLKREWFKRYKALPDRVDEWIQSWDCTFKGSDGTDYVVGQVWARVGASFYLVDQVRDRMGFTATQQAIRDLSAKHPKAIGKLIEDKANGPAIIETLSRELSGIIPVDPQGGKEARVSAISPLIEAGNVYFPEGDGFAWVGDLIEECASFPLGKHDDQVDAMSQALLRLGSRRGLALLNAMTQM